MKRIFSVLSCLLLAISIAGCGTKNDTVSPVLPTSTPVPAEVSLAQEIPAVSQAPVAPEAEQGELVEMQASPASSIANQVGENLAGSLSVIVENQLGMDVGEFYVRIHPQEDSDNWGDELIENSFLLGRGSKMVYYFQPARSAGSGSSSSVLYDLRVICTDEDENEFYFRSLPLQTITQITLRLNGTGDDAWPYATYMVSGGTKEFSTLQEVMRRVGAMEEDYEDEEEDYYEDDYLTNVDVDNLESDYDPMTPENTEPTQAPQEAAPTQAPEAVVDTGEINGSSNEMTDDMQTANGYMGDSYGNLTGELGGANGDDYAEIPELGNVGYHYYDSYTVMTQVGEDGTETVIGVY
ncbi:MAG: hypothetical protein IKE58_08135 [Blautia sp.]|nr:hypothetical protein [Blautia sp.]